MLRILKKLTLAIIVMGLSAVARGSENQGPQAQAPESKAKTDVFATKEIAPGWTLSHFGQGEQKRFAEPLQAAFENGKFTLRADSGMLFFKRSDEADGIGFVHQPFEGDGSIAVKITKFDDFHEWGGAGIMLREENKPLGLYMCAMLETTHQKPATGKPPEKQDQHQAASIRARRQVNNEGFRVQQPKEVKPPVWLKIERQGKKFTSSYSNDGTTWNLLKEMEIDMGAKIYAGLTAWNRYGKGKFGTVVFEDVQIRSAKAK